MRDMRGIGILLGLVGIVLFYEKTYLTGASLFLAGIFFLFFKVIIYQIKLKIWHKENYKNNLYSSLGQPSGRKPPRPRNKL